MAISNGAVITKMTYQKADGKVKNYEGLKVTEVSPEKGFMITESAGKIRRFNFDRIKTVTVK